MRHKWDMSGTEVGHIGDIPCASGQEQGIEGTQKGQAAATRDTKGTAEGQKGDR